MSGRLGPALPRVNCYRAWQSTLRDRTKTGQNDWRVDGAAVGGRRKRKRTDEENGVVSRKNVIVYRPRK